MDDDIEKLYELTDLITPMAIRVAATLRVADRIASGLTTLTELAAEVKAEPDALGRLLRYLAARGVFAEPEPQDWSGTHHMVDVGGGTGTLLTALLQAHSHLLGTLVELPATAAAAERALAAAGLSERCDVVSGSFFDPLPAGADIYLLTSIVHDWNDTDATTILRRCAQAAGPGGRVLLGELVATGDEDRRTFTHMDLRMLVYLGGRERNLEEFTSLTKAAGLTITSVTPAEWGSLIDCAVL